MSNWNKGDRVYCEINNAFRLVTVLSKIPHMTRCYHINVDGVEMNVMPSQLRKVGWAPSK